VRLLKLARIRADGYPVGVSAPMHLNCPCGAKPAVSNDGAACSCGRQYDGAGWLVAQPKTEEV
jgi:hypothetical protein